MEALILQPFWKITIALVVLCLTNIEMQLRLTFTQHFNQENSKLSVKVKVCLMFGGALYATSGSLHFKARSVSLQGV